MTTKFFFLQMCNESLGQCVSIHLCSDVIEFNDGSNMFQVRFGDDEEEVESCHYLEKCCDPESIIQDLPDIQSPVSDKPIHELATRSPTVNLPGPPTPPTHRTPPTLPSLGQFGGGSSDSGDLSDEFTTEDPESRYESPDESTQGIDPFKAPIETTPSIIPNVTVFTKIMKVY